MENGCEDIIRDCVIIRENHPEFQRKYIRNLTSQDYYC